MRKANGGYGLKKILSDNKSAVLLCTCGKQLGLSYDFLASELKKNKLAVEDKEVEEAIDRLRSSSARYEEAGDREVKDGD